MRIESINDICLLLLKDVPKINRIIYAREKGEPREVDHMGGQGYRSAGPRRSNMCDDDDYYDNKLRNDREYRDRLDSIHDRYPHFNADLAEFNREDPDEAERRARTDDYMNFW